MKIYLPPLHQSGLTLLELLVVLTILVVLSTVAITSTSGVADQARYEATQRTLENIRDAVIGSANQRDADGSLLVTGFVADVGRLPKAWAEPTSDGGTVFTLKELWANVNSLPAHTVVQAIGSNVNDSSLADSDVYVSAGWRGPYLNLSPGNTELRDGWGAELASPSGTVASVPYPLLMKPDANAVTVDGDLIGQVNSFGADGVQNSPPVTGYNNDMDVTFSAPPPPPSPDPTVANVAVTVNVSLLKADGTEPVPGSSDNISVRLFAPNPDPSTGPILVTYQPQPLSSATFSSTTVGSTIIKSTTLFFASTPPASMQTDSTLTASTPGPRMLRAYYYTGPNNTGSQIAHSAVVPVMLRAGGNVQTITLTVTLP